VPGEGEAVRQTLALRPGSADDGDGRVRHPDSLPPADFRPLARVTST
jgi:hypothetical protein